MSFADYLVFQHFSLSDCAAANLIEGFLDFLPRGPYKEEFSVKILKRVISTNRDGAAANRFSQAFSDKSSHLKEGSLSESARSF